ncbi:MAG: DNA repair exonuclease [Thermoprotei archaeon]
MKFAHVSDLHVGAFQDAYFREKERKTIQTFVEMCIKENLDFVLVSGDLFDSNIPPMSEAIMLVREFRKLRDAGIRIYCVFGSHDSSPTRSSMIELLAAEGLIREVDDMIEDATGTIIGGVHGLAGAKEVHYYRETHFKTPDPSKPSVFMFHTAVTEANMVPLDQSIPLSSLPTGYKYYAGGHLHRRVELELNGSPVNYPGPLFLGYGLRDLEEYARHSFSGFYIVEMTDSVSFRYVELKPLNCTLVDFDSAGLSDEECIRELEKEVKAALKDMEPQSLILVKVYGQLASGSRANVTSFLETLRRTVKGMEIRVNDNQLIDFEDPPLEAGENEDERLLADLAETFPITVDTQFMGTLIDILAQPKPEGKTVQDFMEDLYDFHVKPLLAGKGVPLE